MSDRDDRLVRFHSLLELSGYKSAQCKLAFCFLIEDQAKVLGFELPICQGKHDDRVAWCEKTRSGCVEGAVGGQSVPTKLSQKSVTHIPFPV